MKTTKCAFCGRKTATNPMTAMRATSHARPSHSPVRKVKFAPLCELNKEGYRLTLAAMVSEATDPMSDAALADLEARFGVKSLAMA